MRHILYFLMVEFMNLAESLKTLRRKRPLVHCLTNVVTVNDCANALLAIGASPVMAPAAEEAENFVRASDALYLNIGTLTIAELPSMFLAASWARRVGRVTVLDPVGAGASPLRTETARKFLADGGISLLRGNISEIRAVAGRSAATRGVDADADELATESNLAETVQMARELALSSSAVVGISGPVDIVSDGQRTALIRNGSLMMTALSGTGCMLSAISAAFLGVYPNSLFEAAVAAFVTTGVCGEIARSRLAADEGPAMWRVRFLDALYSLDDRTLEEKALYEIR